MPKHIATALLNEGVIQEKIPSLDPLFQEDSALYQATDHFIAAKIAFGPRAGHDLRRLGKDCGYDEEIPLAKGERCFSVNGCGRYAA